MQQDIAEHDWKAFKELHAVAMDRFFENAVKEMQPLLWVKNKPAQERFWDAMENSAKHRDQARRLFDDFRRSTAVLQAGMFYANGLITDEELGRFSPEMQEQVRVMSAMSHPSR